MTGYWFDTAPLTKRRRRLSVGKALTSWKVGGRLSHEECDLLEEFAHANGFGFQPWIEAGGRDRPSLVLAGSLESVLTTKDAPYVEFGNHGMRYWVGDNDYAPSRRGYIAIRHDLDLPRTYLKGGALPRTPLNVFSTAITVLSEFDSDRHTWDSPLGDFRRQGARRLDLSPHRKLGFTAQCLPDDEATARDLITHPDALPLLTGLADSFDIELRNEWLFVHGYHDDLSTLDPEIWAWAFSTASRMLDLLVAWGADLDVDHRTPAFYTDARIPRPAKLDGSLSKVLPSRKQRPHA